MVGGLWFNINIRYYFEVLRYYIVKVLDPMRGIGESSIIAKDEIG